MSIDPKLQYCTYCQHTWKPKLYHKIIMLIFGMYSRKCPRCGTVMKYQLCHHVVKVDSCKVLNERIWENG